MSRIFMFLFFSFYITSVAISQEIPSELGDLSNDSINLDEVVIKGLRPVFSADDERITLHVAETPLSEAGSAQDILQKTSKINADEKYGVFVGLSEATIYIDGREIPDREVLKMISSNEIQKVDIISVPSVKYDSKARAVIEITTKKGTRKGSHAEVTGRLARGKYWNPYAGVQLQTNFSELSLYSSYSFIPNTRLNEELYSRTIPVLGTVVNKIETEYDTKPDHRFRLGGEYLFSQRHSAGAEFSVQAGRGVKGMKNISHVYDKEDNEIPEMNGSSNSKSDYNKNYTTGTAFYRYKGDKGFQLNAVLDVSRFIDKDKIELKEKYGETDIFIKQRNKAKSNMTSFKVDAAIPLFQGYKLETGLKYLYRHSNSENYISINENENSTTPYNYTEKNGGLYALFSKRFDKFSAEAGARVEFADNFAETDHVIGDTVYWNIFPSAALEYKLSKDFNMKLSYVMSIHRPTFGELSPTKNYIDSLFYMTGNPLLEAEKRHNLNLSLSYRKVSLNVHYVRRNNAVVWYMDQDPARPTVTRVNQINIDKSDMLSVEFLAHYFNNYLDSFLGTGLIFTRNDDKKYGTLNSKHPLWYISLSASANLPYQFKMNVNSRYFTKGLMNVFYFNPVYRLDLSLRRSFINDKLVVTGMWNDVFRTDRMKTHTNMNNMNVAYNYSYNPSIVSLTVNYKFNLSK